jgi:L-asparagine permease
LNSGLYSTGRVLRSLAMGGSAPSFVGKMNKAKVPYGGILVTLLIYCFGVVLNYLVPSQVFEIVLNVASLGILSTWAFIIVCQMRFRRLVRRGELEAVAFRLPFAPYTSWATLVFLFGVLVLMGFDYPDGTFTVALLPIVLICLAAGWFVLKRSALFSPTIPSAILTDFAENNPVKD